jgi:hypothetical protein
MNPGGGRRGFAPDCWNGGSRSRVTMARRREFSIMTSFARCSAQTATSILCERRISD